MKKILDVNSIQKKAVKKLKKAMQGTGISLSKQAEAEILKAIKSQSESNLEEIIAENLAMDIAENFNKGLRV